ncbi:MAG TPA: L,D-transpeptidase family protein [Solirubrobacterales bacterium]|nr:L,D-transpeptidase family protein [Solirubrobacterales bacterium]
MKLFLTVVAVAAVWGGCVAAVVAISDDGDASVAVTVGADAAAPAVEPAHQPEVEAEVDTEPTDPPKVPGPTYPIAKVEEGKQVTLYDRPRGAPIERVGDTTEFGSERNFWIQRSRGAWFGVPAPELPNGALAWIRYDPERLAIYETSYYIVADISKRQLELRFGRRTLERFAVTVGAPGSPTPPGTYAVTDGLVGRGLGPYYGCCVLALTGHQPNLPSDWLGGDRIAVHGTPGAVGLAASAGCLRATDKDMVSLFARVPLGAPVFIRS